MNIIENKIMKTKELIQIIQLSKNGRPEYL